MKYLELIPGYPHIPTRLAVRKEGLKLKFSLAVGKVPDDAAVVGNFKPRLFEPDDEFWIALPRADGKFEPVPITGRQCCEAFLREVVQLILKQGRKLDKETVVRFSEPPFADPDKKKAYQDTVRKAAKDAGLGSNIAFFREPDAVFEYFRLLSRKIPAQASSINVLVLDFGGGTFNVSVVSTTRQGELWKRYIAAPVAAEASRAGGLYIDELLLAQTLAANGLKHLWSEDRKAVEAWRERHMLEAEFLKRRVSETRQSHRLTVRLDGRLAEIEGGERDLAFELDLEKLQDIVDSHWKEKGIRDAIGRVLAQLRMTLTRTAKRKDVPDDARELVTHVLVAGGSSQLPGFVEHVKRYFEPNTPEFVPVESEYPFVVAGGMGLNQLSLTKALADERVPVQLPLEAYADPETGTPAKATDSTFIGAFQDDLSLFWHPPDGTVPQLLIDGRTSPLELLAKPKHSNVRLPGRKSDGFRTVRDSRYGYQVAYRNDSEALLGLSAQRLNVSDYLLSLPPHLVGKQIQVKTSMEGDPGRSLELVLQILNPKGNKPLDERRIPLLSEEPAAEEAKTTEKAPPSSAGAKSTLGVVPVSELTGSLHTQALDVLCIDFGTTNTTLIDLNIAAEVKATLFPKGLPADPPAVVRVERISRAPVSAPPQEPVSMAPPPSQPTPPSPAPEDRPPEKAPSRQPAAVPKPRPRLTKPFAGTELQFIEHFDKTCRDAGFEFTRELLETVYLSLKVRPFVVLAGPSGVGKSALALLLAEACGGSIDAQDLMRLAVEANWTDSRFLFGRRDSLGFHPTRLYQMLKTAAPDRLYHVLLDEMNLAHVEYYFAQLLSAMEGDGQVYVPEAEQADGPLQLPTVENVSLLRLYGTINVDESTKVLSDKVVDRVNVIEVEAELPRERIPAEVKRRRKEPLFHLPIEKLREWHHTPPELEVPAEIREICGVLAQRGASAQAPAGSPGGALQPRVPIAIGHRIVRDIALFVHYAQRLGGGIQHKDAVDLQVKQRILPKLRGDLRLQETLDKLAEVLSKHQFTRSAERLERMRHQLEFDQFVTFWV